MSAPRSPLAGRYRHLTTYDTGDPLPRWAALDTDSGEHVLLAAVGPGEVARWEPLKGAKHLHLTAVLDILTGVAPDAFPGGQAPPGGSVIVTELVPGRTLQGQLGKGQLHPFKAVAWVLRLIDAVTLVHEKRGVVGSLSPRSIVVEPVGRAIAPVLAFNMAPTLAAFCSPERLAGAGPSADDDVWALHASLYAALTGVPPFSGTATELLDRVKAGKLRPLSDFGVDEPILQRVVQRGLVADERQRTTELGILTEGLDAWERGREPDAPKPKPPRFARKVLPGKLAETLIFDPASLPSGAVIETPEEPPAEAPVEPTAAEADAFAESDADPGEVVIPPAPPLPMLGPPRPVARRRGGSGLLVGAIGVGVLAVLGVAGYFVLGMMRPPPPPVTAAPPPTAASGAKPPVSPDLTPTEQRAQCAASYFEADILAREKNLDFLCSTEDFRQVSARLFSLARPERAADEGDAGVTTDAGAAAQGIVVRSDGDAFDLGWYELAATAIVRTTCCPKAAPISLPQSEGWCQQLQGQVRVIADASRKPVDLSPYGRKFDDAVQCLYSTGTKRPYDYKDLPTDAQRQAFQRFLKHAAESDSKRSKMKWLQ